MDANQVMNQVKAALKTASDKNLKAARDQAIKAGKEKAVKWIDEELAARSK